MMITAQTSDITVLMNSRLYPLTDLRISIPDAIFSRMSSLLLAMAMNKASRNTIMFIHSDTPTTQMTAPPLMRSTNPEIGCNLQQDVVPPFSDGHEQGEQEHHNVHPFRYANHANDGAALDAEYEPRDRMQSSAGCRPSF